ncbi:hypothetical protein [Paenibacillus roseipurpureus]|uniref:Uncharacterized protein n=1 Tax=Paenibacillus roseopurpureus TaxID=2918901 RepID=A0AA96RJJ4_9BACL|nr:hypothetical protein [Paenibacillus sp. MBLB1832]WNR43850.1 hypothetical protein MJB10_22555 [Paenibacillus sp. MBLB1832]
MKQFAILLFLSIFVCTGCSKWQNDVSASPEYATVAYINDSAIDEREFQLFLHDVKAQTAGYFKKTYHVDDSPSFWTTSFQGEVPIEKAKKLALDRLKEIKVQQLLAQQYGLIDVDDLSYSTFLVNWSKENQRREKAIKNNQVIYGPKQYDEHGYYTYQFSNLVLKVKAAFKEQTALKGGETDLSGLTDDQKQRELDASYAEKVKQMVAAAQVKLVDHIYQEMMLQ